MKSSHTPTTMNQQSNSLAMIKPDTRNFISWLMGRMAIGFGICFIVALIIYIGLVVLLYISVSGQGVSITQAAGFPAKAEQAFRGFLPLMLAISLAPLVVRLVVDAFNPFRHVGKILGRSALVLGLGLGGIMLPDGLRFIRGVDGEGLPVTLRESNPRNAAWFAPDGTPVLFFSVEDDGSMRFWNRPGVTPDSGLPSRAVDREVRKAWQQQEEAAAAQRAREADAQRTSAAELKARQAVADAESARQREQAERARAASESTRAVQLAEESRQLRSQLAATRPQERRNENVLSSASAPARATDAEIPWQTVTLVPGQYLTSRGAPGSRIEIRSNGRGAYHIPNGAPPVPFAGGNTSFHNPYAEFRMLCNQSTSFRVSFRWMPR